MYKFILFYKILNVLCCNLQFTFIFFPDRYQCYGKFPDLEEHKGANHGDVCRKKGMTTGKYRCPADCFKTKKGKKPFCQMSRKDKSACRVPPSCCTAGMFLLLLLTLISVRYYLGDVENNMCNNYSKYSSFTHCSN